MKSIGLLYAFLLVVMMQSISINAQQVFTKNQIPSIKKDVTTLAADEMEGRLVGSAGEKLAYKYIIKRYKKIGLKKAGISNSYLQPFYAKPKVSPHSVTQDTASIKGYNVVGFLDHKAQKTVIIGAHYDHLGYGQLGGSLVGADKNEIHNGADDNASGVAAMLALAERIKKLKLKNYNYLFLAFSGEEQGLWGSSFFAKNPTIDIKNVAFMINMDMVGRLDTEKRMAIYGTGTSPLWEEIIQTIKEPDFKINKHESGVGPSDHTSFYLQDLPVLHFFTGQHQDYHKPSDDAELINYEGLELVVDYIENLLTIANSKPVPLFTKTKDESNRNRNLKVTLGVIPDFMYSDKGMRIDGVSDGKPAYNAGLIKGDIVIKLGEHEVVDMMSYMDALGKFEKGQTIKVTVKRDDLIIVKDLTF